ATPVLVLGFVKSMPELMRTADVVVTKAGPGSIGEALATCLPVILTSYLPGQETENVTFVIDGGFGRYASGAKQLRATIELVADPASSLRADLAAHAEKLSRPYASLDIARECIALAAGYHPSGQLSR
ncbi:MAG TPA: glycosyltransferase, partial [Candidatus Dormibacteraeota bacterium]|nr:glycosyltransferase [Candidatus Dormibacteraeota bacterium]